MSGRGSQGGGVKLPTKTVDFRRVVSDIGEVGTVGVLKLLGTFVCLRLLANIGWGGVFFFYR